MTKIHTPTLSRQSDTFCLLLEQSLFFEAHEALEVIWFNLRFFKDHEVTLLRAYINASVSFELIKRGRKDAALKPWSFFQKHLWLIKEIDPKHQTLYEKMYEKIINISAKLH